MPQRLTDQQSTLLGILLAHIDEHGWAPTVREIADAGPWSSTSTVQHHLRSLDQKGVIVLGGGPRMVRVVDPDAVRRELNRERPVDH